MIAVLFDVDLTLVDAKRSGSKAMRRAFTELWGWEDALEDVPMGGRTESCGDGRTRSRTCPWAGGRTGPSSATP
ncbi:MAG: hypothetical protein JRG91_21410 [Deltaproteobacteria bacterium]|nr:hypothetical protein [Deltaproteobacteria bacterium]